MPYKVIGYVTEPVTLEEARTHCRIDADTSDGHPDDLLLTAYIQAAREWAENFTGLAFAKKTIDLALDTFPDDIELIAPATSVTYVKYYDSDGTLQTLDSASYILDDYTKPSWIVLVDGYAWPTVDLRPNAVLVRYVTGYGQDSDSEEIPFSAKAAILLIIGHLYENREDTSDKAITTIPNGAESLLRPLRVRLGMA